MLKKWIEVVARRNFAVSVSLMVFVIGIGVGIYYLGGISTQKSLADQMLHRQQLIARSGAFAFHNFTSGVGRSLATFATSDEVMGGDDSVIEEEMLSLLSRWQGTPVFGIIFVNEDGVVTANVNTRSEPQIGVDMSDRDYYKWSLNANSGTYHISRPIVSRSGASAGNYIIPITSPVYHENGEYKGAIVVVMYVESVVKIFLSPLKTSDSTTAYLLNAQGEFVFSSTPDLNGKKITDLFNEVNFPGKKIVLDNFVEEFNSDKREGKFDTFLPDTNGDGSLKRFLIAYSTFDVDTDRSWTLILVTPAAEAFLFSGPFYRDQIVSLIYLILVAVSFAVLSITSARVRIE